MKNCIIISKWLVIWMVMMMMTIMLLQKPHQSRAFAGYLWDESNTNITSTINSGNYNCVLDERRTYAENMEADFLADPISTSLTVLMPSKNLGPAITCPSNKAYSSCLPKMKQSVSPTSMHCNAYTRGGCHGD